MLGFEEKLQEKVGLNRSICFPDWLLSAFDDAGQRVASGTVDRMAVMVGSVKHVSNGSLTYCEHVSKSM